MAGWKNSDLMTKTKKISSTYIHNVQCCYRTMQCEVWKLNTALKDCTGLPNYTSTGKGQTRELQQHPHWLASARQVVITGTPSG